MQAALGIHNRAYIGTPCKRTRNLPMLFSSQPCNPAQLFMPTVSTAAHNGSQDGGFLFSGRTTFEQQAAASGYLRSTLAAQQQQAQHQSPAQAGQQQFDSELLWAGYSDLSEQLRKMHAKQESLVEHIHDLQAKIRTLQQQPPTTSAWQAATFLLFFLGFINFVGLIANFHVGMFLPWAAVKPTGTMVAKQVLGVVLPVTNTLVVIIFCLQAVKAAWSCLRW